MSQCMQTHFSVCSSFYVPVFASDTSNLSAPKPKHHHPLCLSLPSCLSYSTQAREGTDWRSRNQDTLLWRLELLSLVCHQRHSSDLTIFLLKIHNDLLSTVHTANRNSLNQHLRTFAFWPFPPNFFPVEFLCLVHPFMLLLILSDSKAALICLVFPYAYIIYPPKLSPNTTFLYEAYVISPLSKFP